MHSIETARLQLVPCSAEAARIVIVDRAGFEQRLNVRVPAAWPTQDLQDLLPFYADQVTADLGWFGWGVWLMIHASDRVLIGDCGFKGPPDASGTVEIGYGVLPQFQRQGYATEAAQGLVHWAFVQPEVQCIVAACLADNAASIRVLSRLGMQRLAPQDRMLRWELRRKSRW